MPHFSFSIAAFQLTITRMGDSRVIEKTFVNHRSPFINYSLSARRLPKFRMTSILPLEPGHAVPILEELLRQDLDGDVAVELAVARSIDLAHPARAEQ